ncbi:MAG: hypothetical protein J0I43_05100 [Microbacterium sp.]|uniref:MopE-related protein n=1 Tax=Microbacterium sp. TaxID=51671 RepID=UPI001AD0F281|nr:Calx-beta domain-containing protein [Microbacterium sp.]MBN9176728.1 hypothetical protein [Microbacterium sp.]
MRRFTMRLAATAATAAVLLTAGVVTAAPAAASDDALTLPGGGAEVTLGANAVLRIDGRLQFWTRCAHEDGIRDWGYAASDLYLTVAAPAAGSPLVDASGSPTTVVQPGSAFIEQILAITQPSGSLGEGTYSIVYDTCQDGVFDPDEDALYADAVHVDFSTELPPIDDAIRALKTDAETEWGRWQQIGKLFDSLINIDSIAGCAELDAGDCLDLVQIWADSEEIQEWAATAGDILDQAECAGGDTGACFGLLADYWGFGGDSIRDRLFGGVKSLIANQAKSYFGLYADPARDDFTTPTSAAVDLPVPAVQGGGAILDRAASLGQALQRDVALREAFVRAVERYQGAQAAGDAAAAVAQLRSAAALAEALADSSATTTGLLSDFWDAVRTVIPDLDAHTQSRANAIGRQSTSGYSAAEDRALRNAGIGVGARGAYLDEQRAGIAGTITAPLMNLGVVGDTVAAQTAAAAHLSTAAADLTALADDIIADDESTDAGSPAAVPTLTLAIPGVGSVGSPLELSATASAGATVSWDLDADGTFDDGTGSTVTPTYRMAGLRVVAALATRPGAAPVTAHALIDVREGNLPPVIDAATPLDGNGKPAASAVVGAPTTFSISAHDPEDDALTYTWLVDGVPVDGATGNTFDYVAASSDRGAHTIVATASDPHPGNLGQHAWRVRVTDPDRDGDGWADNAAADCDDADGDVHPGRLEVLLNGKDDDCNSATPDLGTDLGVGGELWTWGAWPGNPRGDDATPRRYDNQAGDVAQIGGYFRAVWWLSRQGDLYGYGYGGNNMVAVDNNDPRRYVYGIGSASGHLQGVAQLTRGEGATYARMADGRVVSWGDEINGGSLGAGTALWGRNYPDYVLGPDADDDGSLDPLTGVTDVWQLGGAGLARTDDGTLYQWGARQCAATGWGYRPSSFVAVAEPALTSALATMVQADGSGNNPGSAIFRLADGSVVACGAERTSWSEYTDNVLRPFGSFGPDDPAVDVDTNGNEWWVVTADGSAWVKTWDGAVNGMPGCTPELCPPGILHRVPLPDDWFVVDVEAGADHHLVLADGRLITWSGENTFGSLGHPVPDNPAPQETPTALNIDGYVVHSEPSTWNGYALVLPTDTITETGWTPPQPRVTVSATGASGPEGGTATTGIELDRAATADLQVAWSLGDQTGTVTVPAGAIHVDVPLSLPAPDGIWGADRTLSFVITGVSANAALGSEIGEVVVTDVDPTPVIALGPSSVAEGDATPTAREITVTLSGAAAIDVPVRVRAGDGTGTVGVDIAPLDTTVVITRGQTTATVPLTVRGNTVAERDRTIRLTADSTDTRLASVSGDLRIADDDPLAVLATATPAVGGSPASVTFRAPTLPVGESIDIAWQTRDGTALAGVDYDTAGGVVTLHGADPIVLRLVAGASASGVATVATRAVTVSEPGDVVRYLMVDVTAAATARTVSAPPSVAVGVRQTAGGETTPPGGSTDTPPTGSPGAGSPGVGSPGAGSPGETDGDEGAGTGALPRSGGAVPWLPIGGGVVALLVGVVLVAAAVARRRPHA